ncbi:MAG: Trk system potassium transporter TrkA [Clostridia bacterium]|nr:Trk system potassium transporter TrkA [Clostridia bacterium]
MKIVIVGCGKIGKTIIESLCQEKHDIVAIDNDPSVVTSVVNSYDVMAIQGSGTEYDTLKEAGVDTADLFISVTSLDELNMLACFAAKRLGAKYTVARIRELEHNGENLEFMSRELGLSMVINPELLAAQAIHAILRLPSAIQVETFGTRQLEMIELILKPDSPLDGVSLIEIRKKIKEKFLICVVGRGEEVFIPKGSFVLKSGDKIGLIVSGENTHKVLSVMGVNAKPAKDVIIMGGGRISGYLAKALSESKTSVKIIEKEKSVCEELCETLGAGVTVVCGDGMSRELLAEEGLSSTDAFVALTGKDSENILISFYAMSQNVPKVVTKTNRRELSHMSEKLGLDSRISPRNIVADDIVRYARSLGNSIGSHIENLYSLFDNKIEALEFVVLPDFKNVNVPLKELSFKEGVILAGIIRGKDALIPSGDDCIMAGDRVVVISAGRICELDDILAEN